MRIVAMVAQPRYVKRARTPYDRVCLSEFYRRKYAQLLGISDIAHDSFVT